jgi:hypothetical protein
MAKLCNDSHYFADVFGATNCFKNAVGHLSGICNSNDITDFCAIFCATELKTARIIEEN